MPFPNGISEKRNGNSPFPMTMTVTLRLTDLNSGIFGKYCYILQRRKTTTLIYKNIKSFFSKSTKSMRGEREREREKRERERERESDSYS